MIALVASIDLCYIFYNNWLIVIGIPTKTINAVKYVFRKYKELIKFAVVGGIGTLFNFSILYVLTSVYDNHYLLSATIAAICTTVFNYTINRLWTFRNEKAKVNIFVGYLRYKLVDDLSILLYLGQLVLFVEVFNMWYIAGAILATLINYPIRYFIIKRLIWEVKKIRQDIASYEWDAFYNGSIIQMWWKRKIANIVWDWIPENANVFNIGCGSSPISTKYPNIICIDINEDKIKFMQEKHKGGIYSTNKTTEYPDNSFDYILCIEVIEHLPNPIEMVAEISRLLKVGGKAVIATPDYSKKLWEIAEKFTPYKEEHHNHFTMDKLDRLCEKYNLMPTIYKYIAGCDLCEMFIKGDKDDR